MQVRPYHQCAIWLFLFDIECQQRSSLVLLHLAKPPLNLQQQNLATFPEINLPLRSNPPPPHPEDSTNSKHAKYFQPENGLRFLASTENQTSLMATSTQKRVIYLSLRYNT